MATAKTPIGSQLRWLSPKEIELSARGSTLSSPSVSGRAGELERSTTTSPSLNRTVDRR